LKLVLIQFLFFAFPNGWDKINTGFKSDLKKTDTVLLSYNVSDFLWSVCIVRLDSIMSTTFGVISRKSKIRIFTFAKPQISTIMLYELPYCIGTVLSFAGLSVSCSGCSVRLPPVPLLSSSIFLKCLMNAEDWIISAHR
jgi:hypothetical protein